VITATALAGLLSHAPAVMAGGTIHYRLDWLPVLGLNANFFLDGLGLLFAGLILGIGLLIIIYARFYLARQDPMGQFYAYLLLFQGAMVGIVLSDNVLLLLVFWELTSLTSFLLIGYWKHLPESRQGALMALTVTGMGGLSLIAGMLMLGGIVGSYDLSVILASKDAVQDSPLYLPALILILIGCFTKSAQFPFHHAAGCLHRAVQKRPEGAAGVLNRQPSRVDHHAAWLRNSDGSRRRGVSHHQSRDLQGTAVHDRGHHRSRGAYA
jgi:multicomponent K+:H+ antiporter subunit A